MRIIPVLDLIEGLVVRGVAGNRGQYLPIESKLAGSAAPLAVGLAFFNLALREVYVADLDAIAGGQPAWQIYQQLADLGLRLWIDSGTGDVQRAKAMRLFAERCPAAGGIVVGLESLADAGALRSVVDIIEPERAIFSLDLKAGGLLAGPGWNAAPAEAIVAAAVECGTGRVIVLDLAQVGTAGGVATLELCRTLARRWPQLELISGGGVRGPADLDALSAAGCAAALVATALHDGTLLKM